MDYNGNEFQDQNCHIRGEGSSKFSPVLHSYSLSKFDFDDGLQENSKFDSLVENESFLSIQNQEDNQWIEDFSRESGVFNSNAPESCSILRSNNNVWFDAASSKSVEILLKSVGQEETVNIVEGSDACKKLNCVAEKMESHFKENENKIDVTDSDLSLISEKSADHGSEFIDVKEVKEDNVVSSDQILKEFSDENLKKVYSSSISEIVELRPVEINISKLGESSGFTAIESVEELNKGSECDDHIDSSDIPQVRQQLDQNIQDNIPENFQGDGNYVAHSGLELKKDPIIEINNILEEGKVLMQERDCQLGTQGDRISINFTVENTIGTSKREQLIEKSIIGNSSEMECDVVEPLSINGGSDCDAATRIEPDSDVATPTISRYNVLNESNCKKDETPEKSNKEASPSSDTLARKRGRPSDKAPGKHIAKIKTTSKEKTQPRKSEKGDKKEFEKNSSIIISSSDVSIVTPKLPDSNTSASPSALLFRQPFSDIQQMQLRAQIFVYGSLIQGAAPDETCMVAAFGTSDGGRNTWETVWRGFLEKNQGANSILSKNSLQLQSGSNPSEEISTKKYSLQDTVLPSPINPMIPLSSPLWNISTNFYGLQSSVAPKSSNFNHRQNIFAPCTFPTPPSKNISHSFFPAQSINNASQNLTPIKESVPPVASGANNLFPTNTVNYSSPSISGPKTAEPKSRKRKKSNATDNFIQIPLFPETQKGKVPAMVPLFSTPVIPHFSSSVVVSNPLFGSKINDATIVATASPSYISDQQKIIEPNIEKNSILSEDASIKAEEAAALATSAVSHCQNIWDQNNINQKNIGLVSAAAAVAKAAAAAAQIALNAAIQAKIMADEAWLISSGINNMENSIIKTGGDEGNFLSSVLVAAKEAAKKRVEAANFASKRAENLNNIVKAAELAASAVSQAGKIVAMGDSPSLAKLVEAGPEGYWKMPQTFFNEKYFSISGEKENDEPSQKKAKNLNSISGERKKNLIASDLDKTIGFVLESEGTSIKEGSIVEVKKEGNGFKEAWFPANVSSIENGKALISYDASRSGLAQPKEWVALECDRKNAPRIRLSQPVTDVQNKGIKKRRRGEISDYVWSVGDKVDVWVKECWREGVITDKNKIDSTTVTVHFQAEGETSAVRVWHLRQTLIWENGEWVENSGSIPRDPSQKGDTPQEKRLKLGDSSIEESKKNELSKTFQLPGPERPEELQLLPLSDNEKIFNVGNNFKKDVKLDASGTARSGLQKEGSRVVFGVPKPANKKKFMEVNKLKEKYTMPKNNAKEKQKPISSFGRTLSQKDIYSRSDLIIKNEGKNSASTDGNELEKQKSSFVSSSSALSRNTSNSRSERAKRGNRVPILNKSNKNAKDNLDACKKILEIAEPRRSNRRVQPTSKLLEGLQSSLIPPKFPSFAHDKGHRSQNKSTPKGK